MTRLTEFLESLLSRKFLIVIAILIIVTYLLTEKMVSEVIWSNVVNWLITAYIVGNVAQKLTGGTKL